jgi:hypothetical protein
LRFRGFYRPPEPLRNYQQPTGKPRHTLKGK